jgi:hypothetical protein
MLPHLIKNFSHSELYTFLQYYVAVELFELLNMISSLSKGITANIGLRSFDTLNNYSTNRAVTNYMGYCL